MVAIHSICLHSKASKSLLGHGNTWRRIDLQTNIDILETGSFQVLFPVYDDKQKLTWISTGKPLGGSTVLCGF